jgi:hypothetical protein
LGGRVKLSLRIVDGRRRALYARIASIRFRSTLKVRRHGIRRLSDIVSTVAFSLFYIARVVVMVTGI